MAAFALVDVFEDCYAFLWLGAALEDSSNAAPNQLSVDYGISCCSALHLSSQDFIG